MLVTLLIPNIRETATGRFDLKGFVLAGPGLAAFLTGLTLAGLNLAPLWGILALVLGGMALTFGFVRHALRVADPLVDLRLLMLPTFRIAVMAGSLFRMSVGALPFLLPLMFQLGFGMTAFDSGLLTFSSGMGAMAMKFAAQPLLRRFGFRGVLMGNAVISGVLILGPAFFIQVTPVPVIVAVLVAGGLSRSLQFTSINAIGYAEVPAERLSSATSFTAVLQQLSGSVGITLAAMGLEICGALRGTSAPDLGNFPYVFALLAGLALSSAAIFARLHKDAGQSMVQAKAAR